MKLLILIPILLIANDTINLNGFYDYTGMQASAKGQRAFKGEPTQGFVNNLIQDSSNIINKFFSGPGHYGYGGSLPEQVHHIDSKKPAIGLTQIAAARGIGPSLNSVQSVNKMNTNFLDFKNGPMSNMQNLQNTPGGKQVMNMGAMGAMAYFATGGKFPPDPNAQNKNTATANTTAVNDQSITDSSFDQIAYEKFEAASEAGINEILGTGDAGNLDDHQMGDYMDFGSAGGDG